MVLAGFIEHQLEENPEQMAGLFCGLVLGSVVVAWGLLEHRDARRVTVLGIVGVVMFLLLGLKESTSADEVASATTPAPWLFFVAGAIAICAMILPGISGSFILVILVILGMYGHALDAVSERDLLSLAALGVGCAVGLAVFSQGLHWALAHRYDDVMAALVGLMVGSLRVLWPWPAGVDSTALSAPSGPIAMPVALAAAGFAVVVVVDRVAARIGGPSHSQEVADLTAD